VVSIDVSAQHGSNGCGVSPVRVAHSPVWLMLVQDVQASCAETMRVSQEAGSTPPRSAEPMRVIARPRDIVPLARPLTRSSKVSSV
jgi:hypothetical protein